MRGDILVSFATLFLIILFFLYLDFFGNPVDKYQIVKDTKRYLVEKGYDEQDILSIESDYYFKRNSENMSGTVSHVVFKNEPNIHYTYVQWKKTKEIQQHCTYYDLDSKSEKWQQSEQLKNHDTNCTQRDG